MADAGIEGPQACPRGLRHGYGIATALGHASITTTAVYTAAAGIEARDFLTRMWEREADSAGSGA